MSSSNAVGGDDFVNICFTSEDSNPINEANKKDKNFNSQWVDKCMLQPIFLFYTISTSIVGSARHSGPPISGYFHSKYLQNDFIGICPVPKLSAACILIIPSRFWNESSCVPRHPSHSAGEGAFSH
jgi:hypothetical protein